MLYGEFLDYQDYYDKITKRGTDAFCQTKWIKLKLKANSKTRSLQKLNLETKILTKSNNGNSKKSTDLSGFSFVILRKRPVVLSKKF